MSSITENDRVRWESLWRNTLWERAEAGHWSPITTTSPDPLVVLTARNPGGLRLPILVNQAREVVLQAELSALGCTPQRARGRSPDGTWCEEDWCEEDWCEDAWCEDGWQIPHALPRTRVLLCRYGQLAGWVTDADGAHLVWCAAPLA